MRRTIVIDVFFILLVFFSTFLTIDCFFNDKVIFTWYVCSVSALLSYLMLFVYKKHIIIDLDVVFVIVCVFVAYVFIRALFSDLISFRIFLPIIFLLLFCFFRSFQFDSKQYFDVVIVVICSLQSIYGIMQFLGILNKSSLFNAIGSFDNPAGYAICLSVGYSFCLVLIAKRATHHIMMLFLTVIIIIGVLISGSRAGVVTVTLITIIYILNRYKLFFLKNRKWILGIMVICTLLFVTLFMLKKDSAMGRVLIWKTSLSMIEKCPILGSGNGAFLAHYMEYQAKYFENNHDNRYELLADNVTHPFNEYLLLLIEYGIIGLLLLIVAIVLACMYVEIKSRVYVFPLLSVAIFSCFSYPLRYPFVVIIIAYCLSRLQAAKFKNMDQHIRMFFHYAVISFIITSVYYFINDVKFEYQWNRLQKLTDFGKTKEAVPLYAELTNNWRGNPLFLYNYGALLNSVGDFRESISIVNRCEKYFNDYDVQILLADNYLGMGQFDNAEKCYITASNMIPNRFIPLYKLMLLYESKGCKQKAVDMAVSIIDKKIKIPSGVVNQIRREAQELVDNSIEYSGLN